MIYKDIMDLVMSNDSDSRKNDLGGVVVEKQLGSPNHGNRTKVTSRSKTKQSFFSRLFDRKTKRGIKDLKKDKKKKKFRWWYIPLGILALILIVSLFFGGKLAGFLNEMGVSVGLKDIAEFITGGTDLEQTDGRTNFLLIGIDTRPNSPGLRNTDSIMIISYDHETKRSAMISIPRDTEAHYEINGSWWRTKINGVYAKAEDSLGEGQGIVKLAEVTEEITGLKAHYGGIVNYYAFVQIVDELGGVDVCVERTFTDYNYPKPGEEPGSSVPYESTTIHFDEGCQHMDGENALIYARSRQSQGPEGSDYARARRQQKVVAATYDKFKESSAFSKFDKVMEFKNILGDNVRLYSFMDEDREISGGELRTAFDMRNDMDTGSITNIVLDPSVDFGRLFGENRNFHSVPVNDDWAPTREFIKFALANPEVYEECGGISVCEGGAGSESTEALKDRLNSEDHFYATYKGRWEGELCTGNLIKVAEADEGEEPTNDSADYIVNKYGGQIKNEIDVSTNGVSLVVIVCD